MRTLMAGLGLAALLVGCSTGVIAPKRDVIPEVSKPKAEVVQPQEERKYTVDETVQDMYRIAASKGQCVGIAMVPYEDLILGIGPVMVSAEADARLEYARRCESKPLRKQPGYGIARMRDVDVTTYIYENLVFAIAKCTNKDHKCIQ